jgi:photosystem II stability/assembly factor-like uncharacterized protein
MRKSLLLCVGIALTCLFTTAQKINLEQFKNLKPRNIGPAGMSGRITTIDVVLDNPNIIYLGSASGGVWKTENSGNTWTPVFDEQPTQNIGTITIQQSNPNIVWVGTGEGNPRNSVSIGEGIFKSLDAGKTWKRMGLENTRNIHRILIDPVNPNTVYVAAVGNPYGIHPERGVFKTTDGGDTWTKILYTNDTSGCSDLVMDPSNPNRLLASMWQHRRTPWDFKSGGPGSGLYLTIDGGKNWKKEGKDDGLPEGNYGKIGLAFATNQPTRVYALVEATKNGLYKSDDGGAKWELVTNEPRWVTNRPFYFQDIRVDPQNENRIYNVHDFVEVSEDGGRTFATLIPYSGIHPDHHAWWIHPKNGSFMIEGNDGGIGVTHDRGKNWSFDDKIPVGQFYHINTDNEMPYNVMGGLQDNGSWHGPAYTWIGGGIRNDYWDNIGGGDGFDVMPDAEDASWVYSESQGGFAERLNWKTGESWFIKPPPLDPKLTLRFNWNTGMAQDPFDKKTIYLGGQLIHKSVNKGARWEIITPDLTTNDTTEIKAYQNTGGLTLDITGAETHCTIITISPSAKQQGVIWAGTDDGNVQLTKDGGKTWENFRGKIPGMPVGCWVPQITASRYDAGEAFVVANDYRRGDFKPYIFRTTDYGKTWKRMVDENKVRGYALCMIEDPVEPNLIFVGTENGLWISFDNGSTFQQWKNSYPSVSTYDLAIQEREGDLIVATFGRSLWVFDDIRPFRKLAANKGAAITDTITVFNAPDAYQAEYRPATGYEWSVDGLYEAENRKRGAEISFFINKPKSQIVEKDSLKTQPAPAPQAQQNAGRRRGGGPGQGPGTGKKSDSAKVRIYNEKNELIRSLRWDVDSGFNRQYWGMEEKGFRQPGSPKPQPDAQEPGGFEVLPGRYKVVVTYGKSSDSTFVTIKDDPRLGNRNEIKLAQKAMYDRLRKSADKLTEGLDRLTETDETCAKVLNELKDIEGKEADSLRKATTKMQDTIKMIRESLTGKTSDRQGLADFPFDVTVMTQYRQAQQTIGSKMVVPGQQEEALVSNAEKAIAEAVQKINAFVDGKWAAYRRQVQATKVDLFKDYKPIQ